MIEGPQLFNRYLQVVTLTCFHLFNKKPRAFTEIKPPVKLVYYYYFVGFKNAVAIDKC